ncbi:ribonuclease H [Nocardia sp. CNY236]|uniref:ribonuclease H family protein n=1 Tax=Nocardia sp. CNY236 TaxID=1169152 RepID=UPI0004083F09|nr:ribonuclease H [Nocardia sp. CNY236]
MIIVSTDGSCLRNPGGAIGWAWVDHRGPSASGAATSGTNQIAELRAVLEAIVAHPGSEPLLIESDSLYAIKCASEWVSGWRLNGWRTSTGGPVKNVELVRQIDQAIVSRPGPVRFRWVRGHVGNYFNEQADLLAGEAARRATVPETQHVHAPSPPQNEGPRAAQNRRATERSAETTEPITVGPVSAPSTQILTLF